MLEVMLTQTQSQLDLARDPNTPPEILEGLCDSDEHSVLVNIAANPNTSASTLEKLANSPDPRIRANVARHLNTPTATLDKMADDEDWFVFRAVSCNPNTSKRIKNYFIAVHYIKILKIYDPKLVTWI